MAIQKIREHLLTAGGTYDTIHRETDASIVLTADGGNAQTKLTASETHIAEKVASVGGAHGFRYNADEEAFEAYNDESGEWEEISSAGGGGTPVGDVSSISTVTSSGKVYVKWTDPEDLVVSGVTIAEWDGTLLIRKAGSAPVSRKDGTIVIDSKTRNAYSASFFCDSGLSNGVTYYYKFFPYTTSKVYTDSASNAFSAVPSAVAPGNVSGISATIGSQKVYLKWTDPSDTVVSGITTSQWAGTKVVYKTGSYPASASDGTVAINSTTRSQYATTAFTVTGLTNGTKYYFAFFPYSTDGAVNTSSANRATATPALTPIATVPSQSGTLTYTGNSLTPSWSNYDSTKMTLGGTTSGVNAGTYTATFTPKSDYCWSDNSVTAKSVNWAIGKAAGSLSISPSTMTLNSSATSGTITVTRAGNGTITASSNDTSVATVSVSGTTVTVSSVNGTTGTATITVNVAAGTNHTAPTSKTCAVTAQFLPAKKTLDNSTWSEISQVAKAGKGDEYWNVGDTKTISFNGTNYLVQIIGFDHDTPTNTATYGRSKAGITFQFGKGNDASNAGQYATAYYMNSSNTNSGGWTSCAMRTSTMVTMKGYLPDELEAVLVMVNKLTSAGAQSSTINTTSDQLFLLSEVEIFGTTTYSFSGEGTQYAYYSAGNSKVRYRSGSAADWWGRSPFSSNSAYFCGVISGGGADYSTASYTNGVSFGFCI